MILCFVVYWTLVTDFCTYCLNHNIFKKEHFIDHSNFISASIISGSGSEISNLLIF